jgi:hypothetical protein
MIPINGYFSASVPVMLEARRRAVHGEMQRSQKLRQSCSKMSSCGMRTCFRKDMHYSPSDLATFLNVSFHMRVWQSWRPAISDPTTDRIPEAVMTVTLARAVDTMVARRHGTAPEKLNATLSNTAAKRLKAVVIRGSVEEENRKALKLRWRRV